MQLSLSGESFFVCCNSCAERVQRRPSSYFKTIGPAGISNRSSAVRPASYSSADTFQVSYASNSDFAAVQAQGKCPVMNQPLGQHGRPIKILINGKELFVCCKGCIERVKKRPVYYLSQVYGANRSR